MATNISAWKHPQRGGLLLLTCWELLFSAPVFLQASPTPTPIFPVGTFIFQGSVRDWQGKLVYSDDLILIQAVDAQGRIVAQTQVDRPTEEGINYRLEIPLTTRATAQSTTVGTGLQCVVLSGGQPLVSGIPLPKITRANASGRCDMILATDSDHDGVSDEYVRQYTPWLEAYGIEKFDAKADYDNDGASNYEEYIAGTEMFDPSDILRIREFKRHVQDNQVSLSFEYVGGRVYCVQSTTNLTATAWQDKAFKAGPAASNQARMLAPTGEFGKQTLFMFPAGKSEFFRVVVNPGMSESTIPTQGK